MKIISFFLTPEVFFCFFSIILVAYGDILLSQLKAVIWDSETGSRSGSVIKQNNQHVWSYNLNHLLGNETKSRGTWNALCLIILQNWVALLEVLILDVFSYFLVLYMKLKTRKKFKNSFTTMSTFLALMHFSGFFQSSQI